MSDRGNHGDGDTANTETPIVAWGAGVSKPQKVSKPTTFFQDKPIESLKTQHPSRPTPSNWQLDDLLRLDVEQGDLAPLMSTFVAVPFPVNNVGILPTLYIDKSQVDLKISALYTNAEQVFRQMERKSSLKRASTLFFTEFPEMEKAKSLLERLRTLSTEARTNSEAVEHYEDLAKDSMATSLRGMHYFQVYDWPFLMTIVTLGYFGWIAFVAVIIVSFFSTNTEDVRTCIPFPISYLSLISLYFS
jgi:GPI ethanolamine phosphate transferase 1